MERRNTATRLMSTDFLRLQPKLSMAQAMRFSKTAVTVEKEAKVMKMKNRVPQRRPAVMSVKIFGRVMKIRDGPWSGCTL